MLYFKVEVGDQQTAYRLSGTHREACKGLLGRAIVIIGKLLWGHHLGMLSLFYGGFMYVHFYTIPWGFCGGLAERNNFDHSFPNRMNT